MNKLSEYYSYTELTEQYTRQAQWSAEVRNHYWPKEAPERVLDVGCGPAPRYFAEQSGQIKVGVDIDQECLTSADNNLLLVQGNAVSLPFLDGIFDVVMCQYLLLWSPMRRTLAEMWRVLAPGGRLVCTSEPDYTARVEKPECITKEFISALDHLGADPGAGGKLEEELALLTDNYEIGILDQNPDTEFHLSELKSDIRFILKVLGKDLTEQAQPLVEALENGTGKVYMPVHYGCAWK
jgi:SAM-dependent methyltransferase